MSSLIAIAIHVTGIFVDLSLKPVAASLFGQQRDCDSAWPA
jgi:hypothetical protein